MSYLSILLCLDNPNTVEPLVSVAAAVGEAGKSHLLGVHTIPGEHIHHMATAYIPDAVLKELHNQHNKTAKTIKTTFDRAANSCNVKAEWHQHKGKHLADGGPYILHALTSDLVVMSQPASAMESNDLQRDLLMKAGTPLLMVPIDPATEFSLNRIAVAWNGTIESARAVRDSLPLLSRSKEVLIVLVGDVAGKGRVSEVNEEGLVHYLKHHGIASSIRHHQEEHLNIGVSLLDFSDKHEVDLLVMGGFGHSRLYDVVVGAATGEVMKKMNLPVLFSH